MGLAYPRTSAGASPFRSVSRGYGRYIERIRLATATAEQTGSPSRAYRCIEARRIRIGHEPSGLERWQSDIADVLRSLTEEGQGHLFLARLADRKDTGAFVLKRLKNVSQIDLFERSHHSAISQLFAPSFLAGPIAPLS
jgi:hypothetical protein